MSMQTAVEEVDPKIRFKETFKEMVTYICQVMKYLYQEKKISIDPSFLLPIVNAFVEDRESKKSGAILESFKNKTKGDIWDQILKKDEDFFRNNAVKLFAEVDENIVKHFVDFLSPSHIAYSEIKGDIQDNIWNYIHTLVKITINNIHISGRPYKFKNKDQKTVCRYLLLDKENIIDLSKYSKLWSIKFTIFTETTENEYNKLYNETHK